MNPQHAPIIRSKSIRSAKLAAAKRMRTAPTESEAAIWDIVRRKGLFGLKFRRQQVIDGFIVDFYCSELRCCLECDGSVHDDADQIEYDRERTEVLARRAVRVLRIRSDEVSREALESLVGPLLVRR